MSYFSEVRKRCGPDFAEDSDRFEITRGDKRAVIEFLSHGIHVDYFQPPDTFAGFVSCGADEGTIIETLNEAIRFVRRDERLNFDRDFLGLE